MPNYYGKGVEQCLMSLVLQYLMKKKAENVSFLVHQEMKVSFES